MNQADIDACNRFLDEGEPDEAAAICNYHLNEDPDNPSALFNMARCLSMAARYGLAATLYQKMVNIVPQSSAAWNNLGYSYHCLGQLDRAESMFNHAIELDPENWDAVNNLCSLMAARIRPAEAIQYGTRALSLAKTAAQRSMTLENMAMSYLGTGQWEKGWDAYEHGLPGKFRRERQYANEKRWDGTPANKVVFYGEQGIGDEIMFGSILPDALEDVDGIIECDRRLEGLFKRTFPQAVVHGTRFDKNIGWSNPDISHRCAFGSLGRFYRRDALSFPRKAYLQTCPLRRRMYRALLDTLPGRKIGIAWTGGTKTTRTEHRSMGIDDVEFLCARYPHISFVSLEYKDTGNPKGVHNFPFITRSPDYDDTAALVAELDGILSVTTAVALLAGAVGTECHVLVPSEPTWHWGYDGDMPWFPLRLHRKWEMDLIMGEMIGGKLS